MPVVAAGATARFEVVTLWVGDGAAIEIEVKKGGKKLGTVEGAVGGGRFESTFEVPEGTDGEISFDGGAAEAQAQAKSEPGCAWKLDRSSTNARRIGRKRGAATWSSWHRPTPRGLREGESGRAHHHEHDDDGAQRPDHRS